MTDPHDPNQPRDPQADPPGTPPPLPPAAVDPALRSDPDPAGRHSIDIDRVGPVSTSDDEDTANQSLADAFRVGFLILKVAMIGLVIAYLVSGVTRIDEKEKGVRVSFGKPVGDPLEPGLHLTWPYPFEQVIKVETLAQEATIQDAFYFANPNNEPANVLAMRMVGLNPAIDGSLITSDGGIVHARASVRYRIDNPQRFVANVGLAAIDERDADGELVNDDMYRADRLVRSLLEQTLVELAAQVDSDQFYAGQGLTERGQAILARLQAKLTDMDTGIRLDDATFQVQDPAVSPAVVAAFASQTAAEADRSQALNVARGEASNTFQSAAGAAAAGLTQLIDDYEDALDTGDADAATAKFDELLAALEARRLPEAYGGATITGEASALISAAESRRGEVVDRVRQEVQRFRAFIDSEGFQQNPQLVQSRLAQDALRDILSGNLAQVFLMPEGAPLEVLLNRDPDIEKAIAEAVAAGIDEDRRNANTPRGPIGAPGPGLRAETRVPQR